MKRPEKFLYIESLREASEKLWDLQTFEPNVFSDSTTSHDRPPNVSAFILMLAVVHTEMKNLSLLRSWVSSQKPKNVTARSKELGEYNGLSNYLFRLTIGSVVELLIKIQKASKVLEDEEFKKVYQMIPKNHKPSWNNLVNAASGIYVKDSQFNVFKDIRDQVTFHYDLRNLSGGYKARFDGAQHDDDRPFVSIGNSQIESRFYFADAVAEEYICQKIGQADMHSLNDRLDDILDDLNFALFSLVKSFIQMRSAFRSYK